MCISHPLPSVIIAFCQDEIGHKQLVQKHGYPPERIFDNHHMEPNPKPTPNRNAASRWVDHAYY